MNKIDKPLKLIWLVNGIIILLVGAFALFSLAVEFWPYSSYDTSNKDIMVGEKLKEAEEEGLALQGLRYDPPEPLYNSELLIMPVSVETYDEAYRTKVLAFSAAGNYRGMSQNLNILFLNSDYGVVRTLLDRKANIQEYQMAAPDSDLEEGEIDASAKYIYYQIAFDDSNKDGYLNMADDHDLYISSMEGTGLTKVTKGIDVQRAYFQKNNSELFITYFERNDKREEHKEQRFAIYHLKESRLELLTDLHESLDALRQTLRSE